MYEQNHMVVYAISFEFSLLTTNVSLMLAAGKRRKKHFEVVWESEIGTNICANTSSGFGHFLLMVVLQEKKVKTIYDISVWSTEVDTKIT